MTKQQTTRITADIIKQLLSIKHGKDVYVEECKNGASGHGMRMMDAWAMKRSWTHPCYYGYEIKISRSDFLSDNKWPEYLELCNEFYFVAPAGVIRSEELSGDVGLLVVAKTGTKLFKRKVAPHRIIKPPEELLMYILMCRTRIVKSSYSWAERETTRQYWERWLNDKKEKLGLGTQCSEKLKESFEAQVYEVQKQIKIMQGKVDSCEDILKMCKEMGVDPSNWDAKRQIESRILKLTDVLSPYVTRQIDSLKKALNALDIS